MIRGLYTVIAVLLLALPLQAEETFDTKPAETASHDWLSLIDTGAWDRSWDESAVLLRNGVKQEDWAKTMQATRAPLATCLKRELTHSQVTDALPGAPDGTYVVLQYQSRFTHQKSAIETVTVMQEENGDWKVAGYFFK